MIPILAGINLDIQMALLFVAILGLVWAYFLFTHKRGNLIANRYLAVLISILAAFLLRRTANIEENNFSLYLYFISHGFVFFIGPSIYFHITYLTGGRASIFQLAKHSAAGILSIVLMTILFYFRGEIDRLEDLTVLQFSSLVFISIQVIHILGYIFYSGKLVASYAKKCESYYSTLSRINLRWVRQLLLITSILGLAIFGMSVLIITGGYYEINNTADFLFLLLVSLIIASIVYNSWRQPEIVSGLYEETGKYKNSPLSDSDSNQLKEKLERLLEQEKSYLTQELNLNQLAELIGTQSYLLSQLLNEKYGENFFNFINGHRINFAIQKIQEGHLSSRTLEAIAYESGFNSKSTFNRAFKKKVGCSPKEFYKTVKERSTYENGH